MAAGTRASAGRPWAILQHVAHEGPGTIGAVLDAHGVATRVVRLDRGDPLPVASALGGVVAMGGPMGVHDDAGFPWLTEERALLRGAVDAGLPVLGVCLGAQQLAVALGADVTTGPVAEVGAGQVELTADGRRDPVLGPEYHGLSGTSVPCVHWHQDTFAIPDGAVHLAATRAFPHQAFRWGSRTYGFQFHVEVDQGLAADWRPFLPEGVALDAAAVARVEGVGRRVLGRFAEVALAGPVGAPVAPEAVG